MESATKNVLVFVMMMVMFMYGVKWAGAQVHHIVGDDGGWDIGSDIASWADGRTFTVGDYLWFAYSGGLDKDRVIELRSRDEFESCDVSNPMVTLTDGIDTIATMPTERIDRIPLQFEGNRYFASNDIDKCKKGLKLPIEVKSKSVIHNADFLAQEPSSPSSSTKVYGSIMMIVSGIIFSYLLCTTNVVY